MSEENGTSPGLGYVVDASVAVRWYLPDEDYVDQASQVLDDFAAGKISLHAPEQVIAEVASALTVTSSPQRGRISRSDARDSLDAFLKLAIATTASRHLVVDGLTLADQYGIALYDGLYLVLARRLVVPIICADQKLYNRVQHLPEVVWIADYSSPTQVKVE